MIARIAKLTTLIAAIFCVLALADRMDLTRPIWQKVRAEILLPRQPSPEERSRATLEGRIRQIEQQLATTEGVRKDLSQKRESLLGQLRARTRGSLGQDPAGVDTWMRQDPIAAALLRAIDAGDQRDEELSKEVAALRTQMAEMEGKLIALNNGISTDTYEEPIGPAEQMELQRQPAESRQQRYVRILQDVATD